MTEYASAQTTDTTPRRRRRSASLLDERHTRRLVASQLMIRVEALKGSSNGFGDNGHRPAAEQAADQDLAELLSDVADELRAR